MIMKLFKGYKFKYIALAAVIVTVAALGFSYMQRGAKADTCGAAPSFPAFNIWPLTYSPVNCSDLPMIDVRALSGSGRSIYAANATEHAQGIAVAPGDTVRVRLYIHNGADPSDQSVATARNVFVATQADTAQATTHTISAAFIADNANAVYSSDSNHGGDATITSSVPTTLTPTGPVNMCISAQAAQERGLGTGTPCGTAGDGTPMYAYQLTGSAFNNSVSLGNLPACFPYSAFITFDLAVAGTTVTPQNTTLAVTKFVRNINNGETFGQQKTRTDATTGQQVEFQMNIQNTGSNTATAVNVTDSMPSGLQFVSGSMSSNTNFSTPESLINGSFNIGDIPTGVTKTITFKANVTGSAGTYTNTVTAQGSNTNSGTATASVVVGTVTPVNGTITIEKTVRNNTTGQGSLGTTKTVAASNNDVVTFQIKVATGSTGNVDSIVVNDVLPNGLQFMPGTVTFDGNAASDNIANGTGSTIGAMGASTTHTYQFQARVTASATTTAQTLTNTANLTSSVGPQSSQATVQIAAVNPVNGTISINKTVKNNNSTNSTFQKSTTAATNDTVTFQVVVATGSAGNVDNVVVNDVLPTGLQFVSGSVTFDGISASDNIANGTGSTIGTMAPNTTHTYQFQARVTAAATTTAQTLTNTANLTSSAGAQSSQATVQIAAVNPVNGTIGVVKTVRNNNSGQGTLGSTKSVSAATNDVVTFQIQVNVGTGSVNNVTVADVLPSGLQFMPGTVTYQGNSVSDNLVTGTSTLGTLAPGAYTYQFQARVTAAATQSQQTFTNRVNVTSSAGNPTDTADVTMNAVNLTSSLSITKQYRDLTQGQTAYTSNTNVNNNDTLQWQIVVTNTGTATLTNVNVADNLPAGLNFVNGTFGVTLGNSTSPANIVVNSLAPGQNFVVNFHTQVSVSNTNVTNCGTFTNTATATATNVAAQNATATVNVICNPQNGTLSITKLVRNQSQNQTAYTTSVSANPGDRVGYQITVTALNGPASNVVVSENIPNFLNYASGFARLNGNNISDSFISSPFNIGSLSQGQSAVITFEANVNGSMPNGTTNIVNTATASADRMGTVNSSATVIVTVNPVQNFPQLTISKLVRNNDTSSQNFFQKSVNANQGNRVTFQITLNSTGSTAANNVWVTDLLPSGLSLINGTVRVDGNGNYDQLINNRVYLGQMNSGNSHTITFDATVNTTGATTMTNTAQAGADNYQTIQDTANVFTSQVAGGTVNLAFSKTAFNSTRGVDATSIAAVKGDTIVYTLTTLNSGNAPATNFIVTDDLSAVLNYADMVDLGGGTLNGSVISWPAQTINANSSLTKTFTVRVKQTLPQGSLTMVNTYGNTVTIHITQPQVLGAIFVAPKTGATASIAFAFAAAMTVLFAIARRKGYLSALAKALPKIRVE